VREKQLKIEEISYECMEAGGKQGKGNEPKLCNEDEFSSGDHTMIMPKLSSNFGISLSIGEEGDSRKEKSMDSKERADLDEEDIDKGDGVKLNV
jgi:hypothetical protein